MNPYHIQELHDLPEKGSPRGAAVCAELVHPSEMTV
jgi:hypothetical protein